MVGVLNICLHGVIGPIREDVRTAAHEVVKVGTVGSVQAVVYVNITSQFCQMKKV